MIVYALIVRSADGMALSATTDFSDDLNQSIKEAKRCVKLLAKRASHFPDRCTMTVDGYKIYFITVEGLCYFALCNGSYPAVFAFSFLSEITNQFIQKYELSRVNQARRPYSFIEFDSVIHKIRESYNKPQSLSSRINFQDLSTELQLRPPYEVQAGELEPVANGYHAVNLASITVGPPAKLEPLAWHGIVASVFSVLLAMVGFYRGMSALSESSIEEYDGPSPSHGFLFLCESVMRCFQVVLLLRHSRYRIWESWGIFVGMCLCCLLVWDLRDHWQVACHVGAAIAMHVSTLLRRLECKLPNYTV